MIVAEFMTKTPSTVQPGDTLEGAERTMASGRFRHLPVIDRNVLVGVVTDRNLLAVHS